MSADVLVVDNELRERIFFERAFGDRYEILRSAEDVAKAVHAGNRWQVAFVDFDLGRDQATGLTALMYLRRHVPKLVSYTRAGESGRLLFIAACCAWFDVDAILDKENADETQLRRYDQALMSGTDPTPPRLREQMRSAGLVDELLPDARAARLWRAWCNFAGDESAIQAALGLTTSVMRDFRAEQVDVIAAVQVALFGEEDAESRRLRLNIPPRTNRNLRGVISGFAELNRTFFRAKDLESVIGYRGAIRDQS